MRGNATDLQETIKHAFGYHNINQEPLNNIGLARAENNKSDINKRAAEMRNSVATKLNNIQKEISPLRIKRKSPIPYGPTRNDYNDELQLIRNKTIRRRRIKIATGQLQQWINKQIQNTVMQAWIA